MTAAPSTGEPLIRDIADTARWAAHFRAMETARKDALFQDPFAARLAGERGAAIARRMGEGNWAFTARTCVFDEMIRKSIAGGANVVVNLAAGMDARPYRMELPKTLRWIEVDLPEILSEKERALERETPACTLERVKLDLSDVDGRRALFARIGAQAGPAGRVLVLSEGLLIYLAPEDVTALARDLAAVTAFRLWIVDMASPGLLRILQKKYSKNLEPSGAPMRFGPVEGPYFFEPAGWRPVEVRSLLQTAARHRRVNPFLRLLALLPQSTGRQGGRPWGGVCLLERGSSR